MSSPFDGEEEEGCFCRSEVGDDQNIRTVDRANIEIMTHRAIWAPSWEFVLKSMAFENRCRLDFGTH